MAAKAQGASDGAPKPSGKARGASASAKRAKEDARKRAGKRGATATARDDGATTAREASGVRGYWQAPEEQALKRAVRKHGIGAWEKMRNDPEFAVLRCARRARDERRRATRGRARRKSASERCERVDRTMRTMGRDETRRDGDAGTDEGRARTRRVRAGRARGCN